MNRTSWITIALLTAGSTFIRADQPLSFWKPVETPIANEAVGRVVSADLNEDGLLDLVASTPGTGTIQVLIGGTKGTFGGPANYAVGPGAGDLATADFNQDGHQDVVVGTNGQLAVMLGNGDGTFQSPVLSPGSGKGVVVADFNGDGNADVLSVGNNFPAPQAESVDIYPGLGDGSFGAPQTIFASDNTPRALAAGDLDGNGTPDVLIHLALSRTLYVLLNQGGFTFTMNPSPFLVEVDPRQALVADMDGNGTADVVTASGSGMISVILGNGDGTLQPPVTFDLDPACTGFGCPAPTSLALADLNGDGLIDVAAPISPPGGLAILLNSGGDLTLWGTLPLRTVTGSIVAGDFNADGSVDLAVENTDVVDTLAAGPRFVSVFLNKLRPRGRQGR